jgi:molybdate transport system substrate-binding protein
MTVLRRSILSTILRFAALASATTLAACRNARPARNRVTVAAASNFQNALTRIRDKFEAQTGTRVILSFASTAQLEHQIANGAPFDLFLSADPESINRLVNKGHVLRDSRRIFARGSLALWVPDPERSKIRTLGDLANPKVRLIALANPETAPYGRAAVQALRKAGLWDRLSSRVTYSGSINMAKQVASTGNADAAIISTSLLRDAKGLIVPIEADMHDPLDHSLGLVAHAENAPAAKRLIDFLLSGDGAQVLADYGYQKP